MNGETMADATTLSGAGFEAVIANMKEIVDLVTQANQNTFSIINKRVAEGMDEVRSLMAKAADGKPDPKA